MNCDTSYVKIPFGPNGTNEKTIEIRAWENGTTEEEIKADLDSVQAGRFYEINKLNISGPDGKPMHHPTVRMLYPK